MAVNEALERSRSFHGPQSPGGPRSPTTKGVSLANPYDTTSVQQFVTATFPGSILLEQHQVITQILSLLNKYICINRMRFMHTLGIISKS